MGDQFQSEEKLVTACGGFIQDPDQYPSAFYQGKRVYFCNQACLKAFEAAPNAFMNGEVEHPHEED
jgi:YHS domain-containing protein